MEEAVGYSPWDHKELDMTEQPHLLPSSLQVKSGQERLDADEGGGQTPGTEEVPIIGTLASVSILFSSLTSSQHCVGWHQSIDSTSLQYKPEWLLNTGVKNSCLDWGNTIISRPIPEQIKPPTKGFHTGLECRSKPMVKEWKRRQTVSE